MQKSRWPAVTVKQDALCFTTNVLLSMPRGRDIMDKSLDDFYLGITVKLNLEVL